MLAVVHQEDVLGVDASVVMAEVVGD